MHDMKTTTRTICYGKSTRSNCPLFFGLPTTTETYTTTNMGNATALVVIVQLIMLWQFFYQDKPCVAREEDPLNGGHKEMMSCNEHCWLLLGYGNKGRPASHIMRYYSFWSRLNWWWTHKNTRRSNQLTFACIQMVRWTGDQLCQERIQFAISGLSLALHLV